MKKCLQDRGLQWSGHVERIKENAWTNNCRTFKIRGTFPRGIHRKTWNELIRSGLKESNVNKNQVQDLKVFHKKPLTHASVKNTLKRIL